MTVGKHKCFDKSTVALETMPIETSIYLYSVTCPISLYHFISESCLFHRTPFRNTTHHSFKRHSCLRDLPIARAGVHLGTNDWRWEDVFVEIHWIHHFILVDIKMVPFKIFKMFRYTNWQTKTVTRSYWTTLNIWTILSMAWLREHLLV